METAPERHAAAARKGAHAVAAVDQSSFAPPKAGLAAAPQWGNILLVAEPLSVAAVFVYMLWRSWLRWLDPLIDFPDTLYFAWRLSEGDLLYKNLATWYGPLPHLVEAAGFRLFGVGLDTVVWMNIALTVGVLLLVRNLVGALGNRLTVWLSSVVFVVVFAFNHDTVAGNFNFITPYAAQATYGFAGLLLVLWGLLRRIKSGRPGWFGVAGLGLAVTYLDKPEPLLAAAGAVSVYLVARMIQLARWPAQPNPGRAVLAAAGWWVGGFLSLWLPVFLFFLKEGGLGYALLATDYVPHTLLDPAIRNTVSHSTFHLQVMGFDQPGKNFRIQLLAGGLLGLVCVLLAVAARGWTRARLFGLAWWLGLVAVCAVATGAGLGLGRHDDLLLFWQNLGRALVFPVVLAAGVVAVWSWWSAWHNRAELSHALGLAVVGVGAGLMLTRMIFNGTLDDLGFVMMPLAVCFLIQLMMVEAARPGPGHRRANWLLPAAFSGIVLFGAGVLGWESLRTYVRKTYAVGAGRDHFYAFPPEISMNGPILAAMIDGVHLLTPKARTLVAFPQGIAVNYHLRLPSTLPIVGFHPDYLGYYGGPQQVLQDLQAHPPDVIFLHFLPNYQKTFGVKYFGDTEAGGRDILAWINDHYQAAASVGTAPGGTSTGHVIDLYAPKAPASPGAPAVPVTLGPGTN